MTYTEATEFLFSLRRFGWRLGLETIQRLLNLLGNPQRSVPSAHIGGTNGRGSTAAMLAAILQTAGHRTGLYTSPHLLDFTERIRVNGRPIGEAEVTQLTYGGGSTTRVPSERRTCSAAIETCDWSRSEPQPGK